MKNASKKAALFSCLAMIAQTAAVFPAQSVSAAGNGPVYINEVCAKNTTFKAADGNCYDFIELYNSSSSSVDLSGYGISDNSENPYKFTFPQGSSINAGGHLLVFCDSGELQLQGQYTASFGISTDGENIVLSDRNGNAVDSVTFGSIAADQSYGRVTDGSAEYAFMNMTPGSANRSDSVIEKNVPAPVFSVPSGYCSGSFDVMISAENGAKIYYTLDSSDPTAASQLYTSPIRVSADQLPQGNPNNNVPGQQTPGQVQPGAGDWGNGNWGNFGGFVGAGEEDPNAGNNNQWGGNFGGNWGAVNPGDQGNAGNNQWGGNFGGDWGAQGGAVNPGDQGDAGNNQWGGIGGNWGDIGGGNWGGDFGGGNWGGFPGMYPTYYAGLPDAKKDAFVIRAVAVDSEGNRSAVSTAVYFMGIQNTASYYQNMKVISIVTDSENLNNAQTGIYTNSNNSGREWERPATMSIFSGGKEELVQDVGIRIHGGYTRQFAQKSFNVYARDEYGKSKVEYDLFSGTLRSEATGKKIKKFDSFIIRNTGNDSEAARFRDKLNQKLVEGRNFLQQAMEPCIVFINGEYFGQYELTEKISKDYINDHTEVPKKNICIIKNQELEEGTQENFQEYTELGNWIRQTDFSSASNYAQLCSKVDMDSFIDYMSCQIFFGNNDWGKNNVALWKSVVTDDSNPYSDGRWRFLMFDTEYSVNLYGQIPASTNTFSKVMRDGSFIGNLLTAAMKNTEFKKKFATAFMDIANYNFESSKITSLIKEYSELYRQPAVDTLTKFYSKDESAFTSAVSAITEFYNGRYASITSALKSTCGLTGTLASVTVRNDAGKGTVKVNTLTPDMKSGSYTGKYYTDYPVTLSAEPAEGHVFSGWQLSDGTVVKSNNTEITVSGDMTVTALYDNGDVGGNTQPSQPQTLKGDLTSDGNVNASDLVVMMNYLLGKGNVNTSQADLNGDGRVNIADLILLKNIIIS